MSREGIDRNEEALGKVFPTPRVFTLSDGTDVVVYKSKLKHFKEILGFLKSVIAELQVQGGTLNVNVQDPAFLLQLISNRTDEVYLLASYHCSLSVAELLEVDTDDAILLVADIVQYNKRFFIERVAPALSAWLALSGQG
jgi:hypothetical protein